MNIEFKIQSTEYDKISNYYELYVDGKSQLKVKKGELRTIINEVEKYCRLRFKGELQHKKS